MSDCDDFMVVTAASTSQQKKKGFKMDYSALSKTCDRYGVSNRAGAAIASTVLQATKPIINGTNN